MEQLLEVVLQRCSSQKKLILDVVAVQEPEKLRLVAFQSVGLVHDEHRPLDGAETSGVDRNQLVAGQEHVEFNRVGFDAADAPGLTNVFFEAELVLANYGSGIFVAWK